MSSSTRGPHLFRIYQAYLVDQNTDAFVDKVLARYTIGTLERLAQNGDRMARRASVLALGLCGYYGSNAIMGRAMNDSDRGVRMLADSGIRELWVRVGSEAQRKTLREIISLNTERQFDGAIRVATYLIADAPWLAEAWNQRALALFSKRMYLDSIRDCEQALEINPYHFGAATGMAQSHLQLGDRAAALGCFRRALKLNPNLEGVRAHVHYLQRTLKSQE